MATLILTVVMLATVTIKQASLVVMTSDHLNTTSQITMVIATLMTIPVKCLTCSVIQMPSMIYAKLI